MTTSICGDGAEAVVIGSSTNTTSFPSGEINEIYAKWFLSPIPPKTVTLNIPMSDALKKVIAKPTDSGHPNDY